MELQASTLIKERYKRLLQWPKAGRAGSELSPAEPGTAGEHPDLGTTPPSFTGPTCGCGGGSTGGKSPEGTVKHGEGKVMLLADV